MATNTARFQFRKAAGADNVDVVADIDDNFDKLDAAVDRVVANAAARTALVGFEGLRVFQTDTKTIWVFTAGAWRIYSGQVPYGRATFLGPVTINGGTVSETVNTLDEVVGGMTFAANRLTVPTDGVYLCLGYISTNPVGAGPYHGLLPFFGFNQALVRAAATDTTSYPGDGNEVGSMHKNIQQHKRLTAGQYVTLIVQGIGNQTNLAAASLSVCKVSE